MAKDIVYACVYCGQHCKKIETLIMHERQWCSQRSTVERKQKLARAKHAEFMGGKHRWPTT
jgi:hypothetical protein